MRSERRRDGRPESLGESFWAVARRLRASSRATLAQWDLTPSQARALGVVERHGVQRMSELSGHLRIAARSATEVVDDLAAKGLVERRADPGDRRVTLVALTPSGQQLVEAMDAARGVETERIFDVLSAADRRELARILALLRP